MMKSYFSDTEATEACVRLLHVMCCDVTGGNQSHREKRTPYSFVENASNYYLLNTHSVHCAAHRNKQTINT